MTSLTGRPIINPTLCDCGCGKRSLAITDSGHVRGCSCRSCTGKRNRRKGQEKQREAFKQAGGVVKFRGQMGNEERWTSFDWAPGLRWEHKSGKQVPAWVTNAIAQVQAAHDMGLYRPGLMLQAPGSAEVWCLVRLEDLKNQCLSLAELGQGHKLKAAVRDARRALDEIERLA